MLVFNEDKLPLAPAAPADVQPRQCPGQLLDILLRVAAIDAQRVQLHQLASVILIWFPFLFCTLSR